MKRYFAPLEGITGYIFRNAYERYYGGIDKYFAPFISPAENCPMNPKERRDIIPENNQGIYIVPQILARRADHFLAAVNMLMDMGYKEFNLNLGCPSGTVCSKRKGAGFLTDTEELEVFFETVYDFAAMNNIDISVKTRVGRYSPEEWETLLDIYNRYPISELIIHPRIAKDYYNGFPRMEQFEYAVCNSKNPVVYNSDLFSVDKIEDVLTAYGHTDIVDGIMLGRGLLYNPELLLQYDGKDGDSFDTKNFLRFHDEIYHAYREIMSPDINVLHHMKQLWIYWRSSFPEKDKITKQIIKTKRCSEYELLVKQVVK